MKDGKPNGFGRVVYNQNCITADPFHKTNDSHYIGFFREGKRNGRGTLHFLNG